MRRLFSSDPITKTQRIFQGSDDGNSFVIETKQDVEGILEASKAQYNQVDERAGWKGDWHHVGRIPLVTLYEMQAKCMGDEDAMQQAMKIWLNDSANRDLRVRPGRI